MKILVFVISCNDDPYPSLARASMETWDSVDVDGVETVFYFGWPPSMIHPKVISVHIHEGLYDMGKKNLLAYRWALENLQWDFMARVNASCYVRKEKLAAYASESPKSGVYRGLVVDYHNGFVWGGGQFLMSRDVVQAIVDNRKRWNHAEMEDVAQSWLVRDLGFKWDGSGCACSINRRDNDWLCIVYNNGTRSEGSFAFKEFDELAGRNLPPFIRVKQDYKRHKDIEIMKELRRVGI